MAPPRRRGLAQRGPHDGAGRLQPTRAPEAALRPGEPWRSVRVREVDRFADKLTRYFRDGWPISIDDVRTVVFTTQRGGYRESQVDLVLDAVVDVMLAVGPVRLSQRLGYTRRIVGRHTGRRVDGAVRPELDLHGRCRRAGAGRSRAARRSAAAAQATRRPGTFKQGATVVFAFVASVSFLLVMWSTRSRVPRRRPTSRRASASAAPVQAFDVEGDY